MKTMKRIKRRMEWLNIERAENSIIRKRLNMFVQNLKKIRSCKSKDDGISVTDIQDTEEYGAIYQAPMDYEE